MIEYGYLDESGVYENPVAVIGSHARRGRT